MNVTYWYNEIQPGQVITQANYNVIKEADFTAWWNPAKIEEMPHPNAIVALWRIRPKQPVFNPQLN